MTRKQAQGFRFDVSAYQPLPKLPGVFITGTDSGVGKTLIAGAIARNLRRLGLRVQVFKPVATGCSAGRGELVSADAEFLAACADSGQSLAEIAPVRYSSATAPNVAALRESRPVDLDLIFSGYRRLENRGDLVVVEGIGGLLCPISDDFWVVHLARMMDLPVVIVARALLGTINHTLLTLHAARSASLNVAGVVINRYPTELCMMPEPAIGTDADISAATNPQQIAGRGRTEILAVVPDEPQSSVEKGTIGPAAQFAVDQFDWKRLALERPER